MRPFHLLGLGLVLALAACHSSASFDVALTFSPVLDEHPFAGVDTLELRWSRPGMPLTVAHVPWKQQLTLSVTPPAIVDGTALEIAAISHGSVVAVGRSAPLAKGATGASAYVGLVNQFVATPTDRLLSSARFGASATRIGDGRVLIAGGATRGSPGAPDPSSISPLIELYDPTDGTFKIFPAADFGERVYHATGATPDGGVLFAGGLGKFGPSVAKLCVDGEKISASSRGPMSSTPPVTSTVPSASRVATANARGDGSAIELVAPSTVTRTASPASMPAPVPSDVV